MKKIFMPFLSVFMCFFVCACSAPPIALEPVALKTAPVVVPQIAPISVAPVKWQVLTGSELGKLAKDNPKIVVYGLDQTSFKNLVANLSEATRYMSSEKAVNTMLTNIIASRQTPTSSK